MIYYLLIGYAEGEESEGVTIKFREEKTFAFLEEKFIESVRTQWNYDSNKKIYLDWVIKSKSPIKAKARHPF